MVLWELKWWEIIIFVVEFGVIVYLIIKAPNSPDLTKKSTSSECNSGKISPLKPAITEKSNEDFTVE